MFSSSVKGIAAAALIAALSSAPAFAEGWGHGGYYWGLVAAIGLIGGALAAAQPVYPAAHGVYGGPMATCYFAREPVLDGWGNPVGYRRVRVCE